MTPDQTKDKIIQAFSALGAHIDEWGYGSIWGRFKIRVLDINTTIQFGVIDHFERWANSVDFQYEFTPRTLKRLDTIAQSVLVSLCLEANAKNYDAGCALSTELYLRKAKRMLRERPYNELILELVKT